MAHVWVQSDQTLLEHESPTWGVMPLDGVRVVLPRESATFTAESGAAGVLVRSGDTWVVIGSPEILINGLALFSGIRALTDRDELLINGWRCFFSTEVLAAVGAFPGSGGGACCPRCKQVIEADSLAVRCPQCGVWHHQSDELPCWTYSDACALCPQPSAMDTSYRWTPDEL